MKKLISIAIALALPPAAAQACGVCTDIALSMSAPFIAPVFCVFLLWLAASALMHGALLQNHPAPVAIFPSAKGLLRVIGTSFVAVIASWVLTAGSFFVPMALIEIVWIFSIVVRSADFAATTLQAAPPASRRFCWLFLGMQLGFVSLVAAVTPLSYHYNRSVPALISRLGSYDADVNRIVVSGLVARGEEAVEPLIEVSKSALANPQGLATDRRAIPAVYCLGKIGGEKAAAHLASVFREKVAGSQRTDYPWQRAVCFAYAQTGGARAALDIIPLYRSVKPNSADDEYWIILAALAMTCSRPGAQFVMQHMDELVARAESRDDASVLAEAVVAAFLAMGPPEALRSLPAASLSGIRGFYYLEPKTSLDRYRDACRKRYDSLDYRKLWSEHKAEVRRYWMKTLQ